jgi:phosphoribosylformimino-5-aminoimidazole carboxamide ribotide isomerase
MLIYPAIDLFGGKAVRLFKGDYAQMTVYNDNPVAVAEDFLRQGASCIHLVDLEGAKSGTTPNLETVCAIKKATGLFCEIGGGIRSMDVIEKYLAAGIDRVILGTAAVTDEIFLKEAVAAYGERIAVGIDIKDGYVAIKGWTEKSEEKAMDFCEKMRNLGVKTLICTDISKDGAMQGTNHGLYEELSRKLDLQIIASGGVSSLDDVARLARMDIHGAIIGKAYYTGAIDLKQAIEVAK